MQPLQCETTVFEYSETRRFIIFQAFSRQVLEPAFYQMSIDFFGRSCVGPSYVVLIRRLSSWSSTTLVAEFEMSASEMTLLEMSTLIHLYAYIRI